MSNLRREAARLYPRLRRWAAKHDAAMYGEMQSARKAARRLVMGDGVLAPGLLPLVYAAVFARVYLRRVDCDARRAIYDRSTFTMYQFLTGEGSGTAADLIADYAHDAHIIARPTYADIVRTQIGKKIVKRSTTHHQH